MSAMLETLSAWMPDLLRTSARGAVLVAVILVVQWALGKRLSPAWRHGLWALLIVRLVLIWAPASPISVYNLAVRDVPVAVEAPAEHRSATVEPVARGIVPATEGKGTAVETFVKDQGAQDVAARESALRSFSHIAKESRIRAAAVFVWLAGFGGLLLAMLGQSLHFGRQVRRGRFVTNSNTLELLEECRLTLRVSTFLALVETDCVRSPALLGCVRPKLLLPCGFLDSLSREEMRHVLLHELAHVKRGDIWSGWLFNLLLAAHWFNPVLWFARRRFIADREAACDAHVLAALDATDQRGYGHTVLNLNQRFNASPWAPGMAGISESNSNLKRRIIMIKQFRPPTRLAAWSGAGLCVCIGLATLTNAQEVRPTVADIVCEVSDVYGYTATNGGTMIAAQLTNTGTQDVTVDVEFWSGDLNTGTKIGRGGLTVPAGKTATEAIPWVVENGKHAIAVKIDPDNSVAETNEENNRCEVEIEFHNGRFRQAASSTDANQLYGGFEAGGSITVQVKTPEPTQVTKDPIAPPVKTPVPARATIDPIAPPVKTPVPARATVDPIASPVKAPESVRATSEIERKEVPLNASQLRAVCQNNMKHLGLTFKMFANESKGEVFPPLSREPGRLMFAWDGDGHDMEGAEVLSGEFLSDLSIVGCPGSAQTPAIPDDTDFAYLGYVVRNDTDVASFADAYERWVASDGGKGTWFSDDSPRSPNEGIARLREGVERFIITDINDPAGAALAQSQIPTLIEWPDRHAVAPGKQGGNVLFMDGHVEFITYPGKWPMTEETIGSLCDLAGRDPIKTLE